MTDLVMTISSGLGPIETRWFVARLCAALLARCERDGIAVRDVTTHGDEEAPRSIDVAVAAADSGTLARFAGTHVLVARSERRGKRSRKRWFVAVALGPRASTNPREPRVSLVPSDLLVESCRSGGAGGQHVNKTESAVRVHHVPSGIRVRVESERSKHRNLALALERISDALANRAALERRDGAASRRAGCLVVERGRPVATWRERERDPGLEMTDEGGRDA
jgi:protein subunit release factor B